jgi:hypothetical protein
MPERVHEWTARLSDPTIPALTARELYAGEQWDVAKRLGDEATGVAVRLWVCSAGYGLIPADAAIRPYSATFSFRHADSVADDRRGALAWWEALTRWSGPTTAPRSLAELAQTDATGRTLVVLSADYVTACYDDLRAATKTGTLSLISAGTKKALGLDASILRVDARLQHVVGGSRQSLNVRVAAHLLATGALDHDDMQAYLVRLLRAQPPVPKFDRRSLTDEELRTFIRAGRSRDPSVSRSRLLRGLRDSGMACEQSRFGELFRLEEAS